MPAQTFPHTAEIPLVACTCEKKPLMVIKSVSPRARSREASVQFVCTACGATQTATATL